MVTKSEIPLRTSVLDIVLLMCHLSLPNPNPEVRRRFAAIGPLCHKIPVRVLSDSIFLHNHWRLLVVPAFACALAANTAACQGVPPSSNHAWHPRDELRLQQGLKDPPGVQADDIDPQKTYSLADLVDFAESHNPATRVAWLQAKSRGEAVGIAYGALLPTIAAVASGITVRDAALLGSQFHRQTFGEFAPVLQVDYLVFDFGRREGAIDLAKANLLIADLNFNDVHRNVIYAVASAYYDLLNFEGQRAAAESSLKNAQTVSADAESRLKAGLATKPDELEAQAAEAQAEYDLESVKGREDIARGQLATVLGFRPETAIKVQRIAELPLPTEMADRVDQEIDRSLSQRPELLQQIARIRAADAVIKQNRSDFLPSISFSGNGGMARAYGQQDLDAGTYAQGEVWNVGMQMKWTLFDGTRREHALSQARTDKQEARANAQVLKDQIAEETWEAYIGMRTALRQQKVAASLLVASNSSYEAARRSYGYGLRNLLDVVSAQKALAQAQSEDVLARTQLLLAISNLAFRTGDLIQAQPVRTSP